MHPICLPILKEDQEDQSMKIRSTSSITVVGYGPNLFESTTSLTHAKFDAYGMEYCNQTHKTDNPTIQAKVYRSLPNLFQETLSCAGDKLSYVGVCGGDSGGEF